MASAYYVRHPCCSLTQPCGWWGSAEYIFLWRKPRFFPPLVSTVPTVAEPTPSIIFGDENLGGSPKSGGRGDFGIWFTKCMGFGLGGFGLGQEELTFDLEGDSTGIPSFGQPYFNTLAGMEQVNVLSAPTLQINGLIDIDSNNRLWGFDLYARYRFLCSTCFKFDLLGGFLYNSITDSLDVNTKTTTIVTPTITAVSDQFACQNMYYAGLVGLVAEWRSSSWALTVTGKLGLGNMNKRTDISGQTTTTPVGGTSTVIHSGFLAQPSNIGHHKHTKFETVPQLLANLQLRICPHIWGTVGYFYMFWHDLALAGEQVNLNINTTQVPGPVIGTPSPIFQENLTSFWVQGITAGLYFCY